MRKGQRRLESYLKQKGSLAKSGSEMLGGELLCNEEIFELFDPQPEGLSASAKELKRADNRQRQREQKDAQRARKKRESENLLYEIIAKYFLKKNECAQMGEPERFYDRHHPIPQSVTKVIREKKERGEFSAAQLQLLEGINTDLVIVVPKLYHANFNCVFRGNCLLTDVLKTLDEVIMCENYRVGSIDGKKYIMEFFFFVADYSGKTVNVEEISREAGRRDSIVPCMMLNSFGITYEDIMKYLSDNFFYPQYEQYWDLWYFLQQNGYRERYSYKTGERSAFAH